jgi:hypothetical protein
MHLTYVLLGKDRFDPATTECYEPYYLAPEVHYIIRL